ncbi:MAG: heavy-metal-associated domain-containing protein [Planctomycetes bacterium]|nr:heavy-metal-associated domain-containing protein [Planctomycetota bacterium]
MAPAWLGPASATVLLALLAFGILRPVWARFAGDKKSSGHDHASDAGQIHNAAEGEELTLSITGMTCGHCVAAVEKALRACPGVSAADVNLSAGAARVRGEHLDAAQLIDAVRKLGYAAALAAPASL